jgi:hypothetical protein
MEEERERVLVGRGGRYGHTNKDEEREEGILIG